MVSMMLQKSKELITIIRELIWPLLEPLQEQDILQIKEKDFD